MAETGIVLTADPSGARSSSRLGREITAAALGTADPVGAEAARRETNWRRHYAHHMRRLVEAGVGNEEYAVQIAERGLAAVQDGLRFGTEQFGELPLAQVCEPTVLHASTPGTQTVVGRGTPETELTIPVGGQRLGGDALRAQLADWQQAGVLEPSAVAAIEQVLAHPEWLRLPGRAMVVLGATAEMGPLQSLLRWGAEVWAVDLPRQEAWRDLFRMARQQAGTLHAPIRNSRPGADLLTDLGSVAAWLDTIETPMALGNYVYADGVTNLRLAAGVDALTARLVAQRPDLALGFLATPTDVFGVPEDIVAAATEGYRQGRVRRLLRPTLRTLSGGRLLSRNYAPDQVPGINDSIITQQGPNYLLAKRVHRWRATVARRSNHRVSMNVAPPTRTRSVVRNKALATAYAGASSFGVQVFAPATSNTLMAALLVHDLYADQPTLTEPWREEARQAVHGGLWRTPYSPRSALGLALLIGVGARN